jgi:tryptophan synthase alpha chain
MKDFILYLTAGFPNLKTTKRILQRLNSTSIRGVEIGVPFSDPVADGPVIQNAHKIALHQGVNLSKIIEMLSSLKLSYQTYLMSYLNPIMHYPGGKSVLIKNLKKANISGLIIPDLPLKEIENININYPLVLFITPNSNYDDVKLINKINPPFVYYIARYGVTGSGGGLPFAKDIEYKHQLINPPLYVGFGISSAATVKRVFKVADGVIVGTAVMKEITNSSPKKAPLAVINKINSLV